jgi:uncharacterized OB-fold protein
MGRGVSYAPATGPIGAEGRYWDALLEGHLELPRCKGCGAWRWPAVWRCGECGSWEHEWMVQPLAGTVFTYTRTHHPFGGTEAFAKPFATLLVALHSVPVRLTGVLEGAEQGLRIGAAVTGRIDRTRFGEVQIPALRWSLS